MTVYWVDPYIDCSNGGIHGTTDTTTRSGTYSAPWGLYDIMQTSNSAVGSVNSISLAHGDEIRLKGQAANLFNFQDRAANLTITRWDSGGPGIDSTNTTDMTYLYNARQEYSSYSYTTPLYMYVDSGLQGNYSFFLFPGNNNFTSQSNTSTYLNCYYNSRSLWYPLYHAKYDPAGPSVGAPTGDAIGIIDPAYIFDVRGDFTTSTCYFCNFNIHVIVTDGWDSETTQNGVTIIPFGWTSTSGSQIYLRYNTGSGGGYRQRIDCPNTFWLRFNPNGQYNGGTTYVQVHNMGDSTSASPSADTWFRMGQTGDSTGNAWNYWQSNTSATTPSGYDYLVDIGIVTFPKYFYYQMSGNSSLKPKFRFQNYYGSTGWYTSSNNTDITLGNFICRNDYTDGACIARLTDNTDISFMDNSHVFSMYTAIAFSDATITGTNLSTITNGDPSATQPTAYPAHTSSGGPLFGSAKGGGDTSSSGWANQTIKFNPSYWLEAPGINLTNNNANIVNWGGPDVRGIIGIADTGGSDYRNSNATVLMRRQAYGNNTRALDNIATCMGNNYDGQPVEILPNHSTSTSVYQPCLIAYNDSDGNYVIQCSPYSSQVQTGRTFEFEVPSGASTNGLSFSIDVDRSGSANQSPNGSVYSNNGANSNRHAISFSAKSDGSGYTGTVSIPAASISAHCNYMQYRINIVCDTTDDYTVKYTIKTPTVT